MEIYAEIFLYVGFVWGWIAFALLIAAWRYAVNKELARHRFLMIFLTIGAWVFIFSYLLRYMIPGIPPIVVPPAVIPWLAIHGSVALIPLFGATALVVSRLSGSETFGRGRVNARHALFGKIIVFFWLFTHLGGILNFFLVG